MMQDPSQPARPWRLALALALLCAGCAAAWQGGPLAIAGALALLAAGALFAAPAPGGGESAGSTIPVRAVMSHAAQAGHQRQGAEVMVAQIVPVWSRQMEVTRDAASDGLGAILQSFAEISQGLQSLTEQLASFSVSSTPGSVDMAVRAESPALQALTAASQRAFAEREAAVAALSACAAGLGELQHLAKQARELARHTRLVAFNASIESNRHGASSVRGENQQGGVQAVAGELRMLSGRIGETAESIERVISGLGNTVREARREGEVAHTSMEELQLEVDLSARRALTALLQALGASLQSSGEIKQTAQTLQGQLDATFVHFQFGDRISQMLSIVANDMDNFVRWVASNPRASQSDAAQWLAALEASYTMEEQRSSHHGNVHVQQGAAVEFF